MAERIPGQCLFGGQILNFIHIVVAHIFKELTVDICMSCPLDRLISGTDSVLIDNIQGQCDHSSTPERPNHTCNRSHILRSCMRRIRIEHHMTLCLCIQHETLLIRSTHVTQQMHQVNPIY